MATPARISCASASAPGDALAPEQARVPFGGVQQRPGIRCGPGCGQGGPGAKVEEEYAHLLDA